MPRTPRDLLRAMFDAAVEVALPASTIPAHLPEPPKGRTIVVGAGKASAAMAKAVEDTWPGPLEGLVVTRYGHSVPCRRVEIVEAAHPVPDANGENAARRILEWVSGLTEHDLVLALISGGGSALLVLPAPDLTLKDKQAINSALLRSGASIHEMNCVRKHLSGIKGGRLAAAAHPARLVSLLISDVPGDDPSIIASGPIVPDPTTFADALAILRKYRIEQPHAAVAHLESAAEETPKPGDPRLARIETVRRNARWRPLLRSRALPVWRPSFLAMQLRGKHVRSPRSWPASRARSSAMDSRRRRPACCSPAVKPP
jgi:glycerate 2-kinase